MGDRRSRRELREPLCVGIGFPAGFFVGVSFSEAELKE